MQLLTANAWQEAAATWREPGFPQTPTDPATGIAQLDSELFCAWLTIQERKEGRLTGAQHYRLPTAAEAMRIRPSPRSNITYRICGASWSTGSLAELRANPPRCATRFQSTAEVGFRCVLDLRTTVQDVIATDSE